jgi:hypothetical protein
MNISAIPDMWEFFTLAIDIASLRLRYEETW